MFSCGVVAVVGGRRGGVKIWRGKNATFMTSLAGSSHEINFYVGNVQVSKDLNS